MSAFEKHVLAQLALGDELSLNVSFNLGLKDSSIDHFTSEDEFHRNINIDNFTNEEYTANSYEEVKSNNIKKI